MKRYSVIAALLLIALMMGCSATQLADQSAALTAQAKAVQAQLDITKTQLQATTQPTVAGTQPSSSAIRTEAAAEKAVTDASKGIAVAVPVMNAATGALHAVATGQDPGPAVIAAAPLAGPYGAYVGIAGVLVSLIWGVLQNRKASNATAAASTAVDAVQAAIAAGQLVVTSAHASATVDSTATSSPTNDRLVDVIAAAPIKAIP